MFLVSGCAKDRAGGGHAPAVPSATGIYAFLTFGPAFNQDGELLRGKYVEHSTLLQLTRDIARANLESGQKEDEEALYVVDSISTGSIRTGMTPIPTKHGNYVCILNLSDGPPSDRAIISEIARAPTARAGSKEWQLRLFTCERSGNTWKVSSTSERVPIDDVFARVTETLGKGAR
jgi:hypothetical protein